MKCQYLTYFCVVDNTEGYIRVNDSIKTIFFKMVPCYKKMPCSNVLLNYHIWRYYHEKRTGNGNCKSAYE